MAEKVGKLIRDKSGIMDEADRLALLLELGDCLWYISDLAYSLDYSLGGLAQLNLNKLQARRKNNTLSGNGDNR